MSTIKLIVGLGNPGSKYTQTRHNAGFWFVDQLARRFNTEFKLKDKFFAQVASITLSNQQIHLIKPQTFMNLSGKSIQALSSFYRIQVGEILIAHDELDIGCGQVRLKKAGGHGGHNGLRDSINKLGSKDFHRLRIGIDHPGHASEVVGYVLHQPTKTQCELIDRAIDDAVYQAENIINGEHEIVMQDLHSKKS